jgi:hypothetical protein
LTRSFGSGEKKLLSWLVKVEMEYFAAVFGAVVLFEGVLF